MCKWKIGCINKTMIFFVNIQTRCWWIIAVPVDSCEFINFSCSSTCKVIAVSTVCRAGTRGPFGGGGAYPCTQLHPHRLQGSVQCQWHLIPCGWSAVQWHLRAGLVSSHSSAGAAKRDGGQIWKQNVQVWSAGRNHPWAPVSHSRQ